MDPVVSHSSAFFEATTGIQYQSCLRFISEDIQQAAERRCLKAKRKHSITRRQKWLGSYYSQEIRSGYTLNCAVAWISDRLGYGVFTNECILRHAYVGEYVGVVKKRPFFGRLNNQYCFDYTIGFGQKTPYIIDAQWEGNFTRYINHSDTPNLETASVLCDGRMHIIVYAIEDIPQGTQLSYDYGSNYWKNRRPPVALDRHLQPSATVDRPTFILPFR